MWWWIASRAEDELVQWVNNLRRRGVLELDELWGVRMEGMDPVQDEMVEAPFSLLWWLILFIEALVLSPSIEREGSQQRPISKGTASTAYPDKSGLRLQKALAVAPSWAPW